MNIYICGKTNHYLICTAVYMYVGHRSLKEFSIKNVINALYEAGFADADWEQLGLQLKQELANIR